MGRGDPHHENRATHVSADFIVPAAERKAGTDDGADAIKSPMKSKAATVVTRGQHLERQFVQATLFSRPARSPSA